MDEERTAELEREVADLITRDEQVRQAEPIEAIGAAIAQEGMPLAQIVATVMAGAADRPAVGERAVEFVTNEVVALRNSAAQPTAAAAPAFGSAVAAGIPAARGTTSRCGVAVQEVSGGRTRP